MTDNTQDRAPVAHVCASSTSSAPINMGALVLRPIDRSPPGWPQLDTNGERHEQGDASSSLNDPIAAPHAQTAVPRGLRRWPREGKSSKSTTAPPHPLQEFFSSVQLWKERSLHHTLEALDRAGSPSADSHMEAIEDHEKGAKHLFDLTRVFLDRTWHSTNALLDAFADDLAGLVDDIVASRLEEQRLVHERALKSLKEENQRLTEAWQELKGVNGGLEARLEVIENTPNAGGDAILCNKLRSRLQSLVVKQHQLSVELEDAAQERVSHRRELEKTKTLLTDAQKGLALTRAMHDKETRQLAAMIQLSHAQVHQVLEASRKASANVADTKHQQQLERFDPLSGCMIVHLAPCSATDASKASRLSIQHFSSTSKLPVLAPSSSNPRQRLERPKSATPAGRRRVSSATSSGDKTPPPSSSAKLFRPSHK